LLISLDRLTENSFLYSTVIAYALIDCETSRYVSP
jgi:hypothetical protein